MANSTVWTVLLISFLVVQLLQWRNWLAASSWRAAPVIGTLKTRVWRWYSFIRLLGDGHFIGACLVLCHQLRWFRPQLSWLYSAHLGDLGVSDAICLGLVPVGVSVLVLSRHVPFFGQADYGPIVNDGSFRRLKSTINTLFHAEFGPTSALSCMIVHRAAIAATLETGLPLLEAPRIGAVLNESIKRVLNDPQAQELAEDEQVKLAWQHLEVLEPWFATYLREYEMPPLRMPPEVPAVIPLGIDWDALALAWLHAGDR